MLIADIDEDRCIGCGICLEACPFDAIIGAPSQMHTIIINECIGCKLCIKPCPMDCISMVTLENSNLSKQQKILKAKFRKADKIKRLQAEKAIFLHNKDQIRQELDSILLTRENKYEFKNKKD